MCTEVHDISCRVAGSKYSVHVVRWSGFVKLSVVAGTVALVAKPRHRADSRS